MKSSQQVFITGCYRSGTEFITNLLGNHPRVATSMYVVNFMRYSFHRYDPIEDEANYSRLIFDTAHRARMRWGLRLDSHALLDECQNAPRVTYALLYDLLMSTLFLKGDATVWAEKNQLLWTKIPDFLDMFPNGRALHIMRDPRNVLASFKQYTYAPAPAYLGAVFNCFDSMAKAREYQSSLASDRYKLVRYEDVLAHPAKALTELFDFLELDANHDLVDQTSWKTPAGEHWNHNSVSLRADEDGSKFDATQALQRWRSSLTAEDAALCEAVNRDHMQHFGYPSEGACENVSWDAMVKPMLTEDRLTEYLRQWVLFGRGVEEFPSDPVKPANWEENAIAA